MVDFKAAMLKDSYILLFLIRITLFLRIMIIIIAIFSLYPLDSVKGSSYHFDDDYYCYSSYHY